MTPEWLASVPRPENLPDLGRQAAAVARAHGVVLPLTVAKDIALAVLHRASASPAAPTEAAEQCRTSCTHLTTDDIRDFVESRWPAEYPPGSALSRTRKENP